MSALVGLCLLSESTALVKNLNDDIKGLYSKVTGKVKPTPDTSTDKIGNTTVELKKFVPVNTVFIDYKDEEYISANGDITLMDIIGGSNNSAPTTTYQSLMPSLSGVFNTPFVQGAFRFKLVSSTGPETSFVVMVIGPPGGFMRRPSVASASSVVEVESTADVDLNDTIRVNALLLNSTKLVSASALKAMTIGEINEQCNAMDSLFIMKALKYFKDYVFSQSQGSMPPQTQVLLNTPLKDLFSRNQGSESLNKVIKYSKNDVRHVGIVLPSAHGKTTLMNKYPNIFIEIDNPFTKEEQAKLDELRKSADKEGWDEYNKVFNSYVSRHLEAGDYGTKVIMGHHRDNLLPHGIRVVGEFKIDTAPNLEKHIEKNKNTIGHKSDVIRQNWKDVSGENVVTDSTIDILHDKVLDVINAHTHTKIEGKDKVGKSGDEIKVFFRNGFPSDKYSLLDFKKNGVAVLSLDDVKDVDIIINNKPNVSSRKIPAELKKIIDAPHIKNIDVNVNETDINKLIGELKSL